MDAKDFVPIRVSTLRGDLKINFDAYVKVNEKHILYLRKGDSFEGSRLKRLKDKKVRKMWRRTFTFSDYIDDYANDLGELMDSSYGELYYWLNQVPEEEVQIFASLDDPLNEEVLWPSHENTFLIDFGGHYGLRAFKFFDDFLFSVLGD